MCGLDLMAYVQSHEGGLDMKLICPIHGTRGTNPRFDETRSEAAPA